MITAIPAMLAALDPPGLHLVLNGLPRAPLGLARAQPAARATALGADDIAWSEFLADAPRPSGAAQRLLIEPARTNLVRNPRAEGAVPGSPGTPPTNYSISTLPAGISRSVLASRSINGLPGGEFRFFGTATAAGAMAILFEANAAPITILPSTTYTFSVFHTLTGGDFTNVTNYRLRSQTYLADGTTGVTDHLSPTVFPTGTQSRAVFTFTTAATAVRARMAVLINTTTGPIDVTVHLAAALYEQGPAASTPILPPVGTPGFATRGADLVSAPLASLGVSL